MNFRFNNFFKNYKNCIKELDQFGVPIQLRAFNNQSVFKSNIGGFCTFLINSSYICNLMYVLMLWQTNQILPTSVRFSEGKNITTFEFQNDTIFEICFWKYSQEMIDPFTEKDNILMPIFMYYLDGVQQTPISLLRDTKISKYNSTLVQVNNLKPTTNNNFENGIKRQEGFIMITDCNEKYLLNGQYCAIPEHINKFKQQNNYVTFFTYISTFNTYQINTSKLSYEQYTSLEFDRIFMMSVQLQQIKSFVNVGILFQNFLYFNHIESYQNFYQQQSLESIAKLFGVPIYQNYGILLEMEGRLEDARYYDLSFKQILPFH